MDEATLTLDSPMTEEQWAMIADYDFNYTNEITFHTKHGKTVRFVKESAQPEIIRCKDCKHYYYADNRIPQEQRYVCDLDGDRWKADSFCSFAERRTDETD